MPIRIARRFGRLVGRWPWLDMECWSGCAAIAWSTMGLLSKSDIVARPTWVWLGTVFSAPFWEVSGIVLGILQLVSLFHLARLPRWAMAFFASCWWALLTTAVIISDHVAPGIVMYATFALANLVLMGRVAGEAR